MAQNVYEGMFIFDSNRYARDPNGVPAQLAKMIEDRGGEILASRLWNEQKLAYPINGQRKGTYWLTYFRIAGDKLTDFNRGCRLNDTILRHLVLKVDPRLVDLLVSHARGERAEPVAEEEGEPGQEPPAEGAPAEPGTEQHA